MRPGCLAARLAIAVAALSILAGVAGCGGSAPSPVVVRVGKLSIDRATVDHWAHAIALGVPVGASPEGSHDTPRQQALDFLIASDWLIGEAGEQGLAVSDREVERGLEERIGSAPNGSAQPQKERLFKGQTASDVRFEVKAALAAALLRSRISSTRVAVDRSQVADFYTRHRLLFRKDRRLVDLIEGIESPAAAIALGRELGAGSRFAARAIHENVPRSSLYEAEHRENGELVRAIFAARPGALGGPVDYENRSVLLVVRAVLPGPTKAFAQVKAEIAVHLAAERRRSILAGLIDAYRRKWRARTSCQAGFVVEKCSQYRGPIEPEADPLAGA